MDEENAGGLKVLYTNLAKAAEFPGVTSHSPRNLIAWYQWLNAIHSVMVQFYEENSKRRYLKIIDSWKRISGMESDCFVIEGYNLMFEFLSTIAEGFASQSLLLECPDGLRIVYDLFVQALEFPRQNLPSPAMVVHWQDRLDALHALLSPYSDGQYEKEHRIIRKKLQEASRLFPSEGYIDSTIEALYDWLGAISRKLQVLQKLIPETLVISDSVRRGRNGKADTGRP